MASDVAKPLARSFLAWLARGCAAASALLLALLHVLGRGPDPMRMTVSEYVLGEQRPLGVAVFVFFAAGTFALALGLLFSSRKSGGATMSFLLLALAGTSILLAGLFPTDPAGAAATLPRLVHSAASMAALTAAVAAMALWSREMAGDPQQKPYAETSARLAFLSAILFVLFLLSGGWIPGLVQRVLIATLLLWQLHMTRAVLPGRPAGPSSGG